MKRRIKDVVSLRNVKSDNTNMPYIALENIKSWDATYVETNATSDGTNNIFKKNDILFGKLRPYLAKGYIPQYDGVCSSEFLVMKANEDISNKYLLYYFLSHSLIDYISNQVAGVKMPRTNWDSFSNISIEVPEYESQLKKVNYLDNHTSVIDQRISILTKKQECYTRLKSSIINRAVTKGLNPDVKFKDSGIERIGRIPEHWDIGRVKTTTNCIEAGRRPANDDEEILSIGGEHIQNGCFFLERPKYVSSQTYKISKGKIEIGDTLIVKDGATIGKCMFVNSLPNEKMLLNEHVYRLHWSKFYYYWITSSFSQYWFRSLNMSSAQESITLDTINNLPVCNLLLEEQEAIANYLDEKCSKIDAAIANIEKQIDALKRLKRALINDVVTGKREV